MANPSSSEPAPPSVAAEDSDRTRAAGGTPPDSVAATAPDLDTATLIEQLNDDRLWLLRQIDSGRWAEWRLDLAALERELGQLLDQARERGVS